MTVVQIAIWYIAGIMTGLGIAGVISWAYWRAMGLSFKLVYRLVNAGIRG